MCVCFPVTLCSLAAPTNNEVKQQPVDGGFKFVDLNPVARKKNLMRNRIRILNYSRKSRENSGNGGAPEREKCNCKHSKCLKLYCECFRRGEYCEDCNCKCCQNRIEVSAPHTLRRSACLLAGTQEPTRQLTTHTHTRGAGRKQTPCPPPRNRRAHKTCVRVWP